MKKTILACIIVAGTITNCTAAEVVGTINTMAQTAATVTSTAEKATNHFSTSESPAVAQVEVSPVRTGPAKWWGSATSKYDEVIGGRKAIATLQQENSDLKVELRTLKAKTSFVGDNLRPFSAALEEVCFLYDGGGIKEALGSQ